LTSKSSTIFEAASPASFGYHLLQTIFGWDI
jgi:hypothetical protein